jgi:sec-independent protein translocase protein TatA
LAGIGVTELLIVLGIVLLIFGPKRLPMLGRQLGAGMKQFKEGITRKADEDDDEVAETGDDGRARAQAALGRPDEPASAPAEPVSGEVVPERDR